MATIRWSLFSILCVCVCVCVCVFASMQPLLLLLDALDSTVIIVTLYNETVITMHTELNQQRPTASTNKGDSDVNLYPKLGKRIFYRAPGSQYVA